MKLVDNTRAGVNLPDAIKVVGPGHVLGNHFWLALSSVLNHVLAVHHSGLPCPIKIQNKPEITVKDLPKMSTNSPVVTKFTCDWGRPGRISPNMAKHFVSHFVSLQEPTIWWENIGRGDFIFIILPGGIQFCQRLTTRAETLFPAWSQWIFTGSLRWLSVCLNVWKFVTVGGRWCLPQVQVIWLLHDEFRWRLAQSRTSAW